MPEILNTPKSIFLPFTKDIEDPKIKEKFEQYNRAIEEFTIAVHSDIIRFHERIKALEDA